MKLIEKKITENLDGGISLHEHLLSDISCPVSSSIFIVPPKLNTPVDQHKVAEIWMIVGGKGEVIFEDKKITLNRFDILYIESGEKHSVVNTGEEDLIITSLYWNVI
ncbi:cupin domain-containing protein [Aquimarina hainanensis]|uniref:Cupin domain-containing protein n=1 Tax=Aquimarina hainanensis TaxID=1578017 RepID=A0ABW5N3C2_9FLAO|nr:cupin domain-containing protein [Aquimarina sp. TRL1]QKX04281.1 cupin domain-containing protein [Aquimarina sp. TRL1]